MKNDFVNKIEDSCLLEVNRLQISFPEYESAWKLKQVEAIYNFSFRLKKGEIIAVVGASGSGKSLLADAILGILPKNAKKSGSLQFKGEILSAKRIEKIRGKEIMLIPQSVSALDPLMKIEKQVIFGKLNREDKIQINSVFKQLNLEEKIKKMYPFQLSGGMARRVLIAAAMLSSADLIIADEPTPGLDSGNKKESLKYIEQLAKDQNKGILMITHDILAALQIADQIIVVKDGKMIEKANPKDFTGAGENLKCAYTKALWNALPENKFEIQRL